MRMRGFIVVIVSVSETTFAFCFRALMPMECAEKHVMLRVLVGLAGAVFVDVVWPCYVVLQSICRQSSQHYGVRFGWRPSSLFWLVLDLH